MAGFIKRISKTAGHIPGEMIYVGEKKEGAVSVSLIDYDDKALSEKEISDVEELFPLKETPTVSWININGLRDTRLIEKLGGHFGIHSLTLEDIVNTAQRPKYEDFDSYIFVVLKMLMLDASGKGIVSEQVSLVLGANFVISFQEKKGDVFDAIRERIRQNKGRIRRAGPDYLAYSLLDAVVDNYFSILENTGEQIEEMEEKLLANPSPQTLRKIHDLKRGIIFLRKSVWPLREVAGSLERGESKLIKKSTVIFLRDLYDHTIQVIDTVETLRDMLSGTLDIYLSSVSNRMNEIMKVLTIFAAIFIPLTFLAGIYGMNFEFIPELKWRWGYFYALGLMAAVGFGLLIFFRRKKWL
ncbi:magnesium/cobalt transporter CorA [bacterium]|nr:magnesium/cobalt transporter CorA [Candidatus Omnitrophota bacterium]MBA3066396.1 magnesium/cobalt transporter CorA [bacterium]MBU3930209.1 magnesium/cobalt transporter CorA [bacterium]MBU4123234.1 magnesium/cobalt transporter CorA [bacterium]